MAFLTINLAASWPSIGHAVATKVYSTTVDLVMVASYFVGQLEVDVFCFGWHIFHIAAFCSLHYVWIPFLITAIEYTTWWLLWIRLLLYPVIMLLAPVTWWFTLMADLPFKEIFFGNGRASIKWERRRVPKDEKKSLNYFNRWKFASWFGWGWPGPAPPMHAYDRRLRILDSYQAEPGYADAFFPLFFEFRCMISSLRAGLWSLFSPPYYYFAEKARKPPDIDTLVMTTAISITALYMCYAFTRSSWRLFSYKIGWLKLPQSYDPPDAMPPERCDTSSALIRILTVRSTNSTP